MRALTGDGSTGVVAAGCPYQQAHASQDVARLRDVAAQILRDNTFGSDSIDRAVVVLEEAFRLDPMDAKGETSALLGRVYFQKQQYGDAVRHLEAAVAKRPDDTDVADLLARASRNCETKIERPQMPVGYYDRDVMMQPPAMHIREPHIIAPLPCCVPDPSGVGALWGRVQELTGAAAGAIVGAALKGVKMTGLYKGNRDAWVDRPGLYGLLTLGAVRDEMNKKVRQDPYVGGELTSHQQPGQKRPSFTRTMPTANGSWRTDDPMEGAALSRFGRQGMQSIELFKSRLDDPSLPSPREVARAFLHLKPGKEQVLAPFLNKLYVGWIQFQSHDWFSHGENLSNETYKVPLSADDPARQKYGIEFMEVRKSQPDPKPTKGLLTYANEVTHWWDGSQLYGSNQETEDRLRTGPDGKVLAGGKLHLPDEYLPVSPVTGVEDSGFTRNWWVGLSMFHTLFARHHNYICDELMKAYPDHPWTSDQLYKTARLINAAIIAKIHTVEWTPAVLPNDKVAPGLNTNWNGLIESKRKPFGERKMKSRWEVKHPILGGLVGGTRNNHGLRHNFSEEFVSVYRLHEGLTKSVGVRRPGAAEPHEEVSTDATRGQAAHELMRKHGLATMFNSFGHDKGGALIGNNVPAWATDMSIDGQSVVDIATVDILRDRERGIPGYNVVRELLGYPKLQSYDEMGVDAATKAEFERQYGPAPEGLDKMDLQVGMLHDLNRPPGFGFDDLRFRFFIQAASSRLEHDPFFNELLRPDVYTSWGLDHINKMSLKEILFLHCPELQNTGLANVNNAFEPWGTTAETHPEEHPLTSKGIEHY